MALRYVTIESVRVTSGITSTFINDDDLTELLEDTEEEIERMFNARFSPFRTMEYAEGDSSNRLVLKNNPVLKLHRLNIDGTDIDLDDIRLEMDSGVVWLTSDSDETFFKANSSERNLVRVDYSYGLLEETDTTTLTDVVETEGDSVVVAVDSATGFNVDDYIKIAGQDSLNEVCRITDVSENNITVDNLSTGHSAESLVTLMRVPRVAEKLMKVGCSLSCVARVVGSTFDEITGYSLSDLQVQKGEPYTQWRETAEQLRKQWDRLVLSFRPRPVVA